MRFVAILLAIVFASVGLPEAGYASSSCPEVDLSNTKLNTETKAGVSLIPKFLSKIEAGVNYVQERNSILVQFPNADQVILVSMFYKATCDTIMNSNWPPERKLEELRKAQDEVFNRVYGPKAIASTKEKQSRIPAYSPRVIFATYDIAVRWYVLSAVWDGGISDSWFCKYCLVANDQAEFLREPPFVVTKANKYFVIVSSAPSRDAAIQEMHRLKRKAPQYDFVVYEPYGGNQNYAIMMATWVPHDVALGALKLAKRDVRSDSFIWACRQEVDTC